LKYACGLKLGPAFILNQNPIFEMASNQIKIRFRIDDCTSKQLRRLEVYPPLAAPEATWGQEVNFLLTFSPSDF
jgi:hypothetical protein